MLGRPPSGAAFGPGSRSHAAAPAALGRQYKPPWLRPPCAPTLPHPHLPPAAPGCRLAGPPRLCKASLLRLPYTLIVPSPHPLLAGPPSRSLPLRLRPPAGPPPRCLSHTARAAAALRRPAAPPDLPPPAPPLWAVQARRAAAPRTAASRGQSQRGSSLWAAPGREVAQRAAARRLVAPHGPPLTVGLLWAEPQR